MIDSRVFTNALIDLLATASGKEVGRGRHPDGQPTHYYIVYRVDRQTTGAPLSDLNEDATLVYQVTCVSGPDPDDPDSYGTQAQLEWLEDTARKIILGRVPGTRQWLHALNPPGIRVMSRRSDVEPGGTPDPTDGIMSSASRFAFDVNSA
ncbi:hypothetical protein [Streptomyces scabiei]|uniref:hypothetical protein n=1 Tax=Streptomyces scabiei TaxID=1930 RepID=UPI000765A9F3|nr:hypothetical protein [Streptomyces scabiei]MDX2999139.1 hypothetical protein [Streptomyces scabiei]MDX3048710.1 hypothetical protein [Streptomyces scabiei]